MSELLIAEHIAQTRKALDEAQINRFGTIEKHLAVLQTRFEAWIERAVQGEDLKELKREMETQVKETLVSANEQQSEMLLGKVQSMFQQLQIQTTSAMLEQRTAIAEDQKMFRRQIFFALFSSVLGIAATVVVSFLVARGA